MSGGVVKGASMSFFLLNINDTQFYVFNKKINMSSTYKKEQSSSSWREMNKECRVMITRSKANSLYYRSKSLNQARGACFKPYKARQRRQTGVDGINTTRWVYINFFMQITMKKIIFNIHLRDSLRRASCHNY
jgi:hypothetical protein